MLREAAVAGSFYPSAPEQLSRVVDGYLANTVNRRTARGVIVPHAGYVYSGHLAGEVLAQVRIPPQVILLGPNHHGIGPSISISSADAWVTPLGQVPVSGVLATAFKQHCTAAVYDQQAHLYEHSLEVMLPFLQRLRADIEILPVTLRSLSFGQCMGVAKALATVISCAKDDVLLLASSDMNHFLPAADNEKLDRLAIKAMTDYDPQALYEVVVEQHISMCGFHAAVIVMEAARLLGSQSCSLVDYAHSGLVNGDNSRVVGYAGLVLE